MANELSKTERWIRHVLANDATVTASVGTRIYHDVAPENATYPLIVFNHQAGEDVNGVGTCRLMARNLYQVRLVARDDLTTADRAAADAMDAIFQTATKEIYPGDSSIKFTGRRESPISTTETERDSTRRFRYLGGLYWITASAA